MLTERQKKIVKIELDKMKAAQDQLSLLLAMINEDWGIDPKLEFDPETMDFTRRDDDAV